MYPTFLHGKNATAAIRASQRPLVMNWIEAVDVHSNGYFRRRCVDHEVEALGLRSAELGARGVPVPIDELVSAFGLVLRVVCDPL